MNEREKLIEILNKHEKFNEDIQKKVGRDRSIVYSVSLLEKENIDATFQRICVVSFKLFSESFSFPEFPEFPDSRLIRNCLWHCVHSSKGWLIGSDKTTYNTTEKGKEVVSIFLNLMKNNMDIKALPLDLQVKGITKKEAVTRPRDTELNFIKEIKESKAFYKYKGNRNSISAVEIMKSLGGDRYSSISFLKEKLEKAKMACRMANDSDVELYIKWVEDNWSMLIGD